MMAGCARQGRAPHRRSGCAAFSLWLEAGLLDHLRPLRDIALEEFAELIRRHGHGHRALLGPGFLDRLLGDDLADLGVEAVDDLPGGALWRPHGRPDPAL